MTSLGTGDIHATTQSHDEDPSESITAVAATDSVDDTTDQVPNDNSNAATLGSTAKNARPSLLSSAPIEQPSPALDTSQSVEVHYKADRIPEIAHFHDHFTLLIPTSTVRYREGHSAARIIESADCQFILEETYDADKDKHAVSIRRIPDATEGVRFLRLSYAIVTAFWTGFFFVFCLQILLFLFLDLAIQAGATSKQGANWGKAIGTQLLSSLLVLLSFLIGIFASLPSFSRVPVPF